VPNLVGASQADATTRLQQAGLTLGQVSNAPSSAAQKGLVTGTNPASGAQVDKGATVDLVVGAGPNTLAIPAVIGSDAAEAKDNLRAAGFTGSINTDQVDSLKADGTVVGVDPGQGRQAPLDAAITLSVSDGDAPIPSVVGQQQAAAQKALADAGFTDVSVEKASGSTQPQGTVVSVDPGAGTQASADTAITLSVAAGSTQVPNVVGQTVSAAQQQLQQAGFTRITVNRVPSDDVQSEIVVDVSPGAGSQATTDTQITLTVAFPSGGDGTGTGGATPTG
jgi:eukaryotic-like serine/threonine-protein kinase